MENSGRDGQDSQPNSDNPVPTVQSAPAWGPPSNTVSETYEAEDQEQRTIIQRLPRQSESPDTQSDPTAVAAAENDDQVSENETAGVLQPVQPNSREALPADEGAASEPVTPAVGSLEDAEQKTTMLTPSFIEEYRQHSQLQQQNLDSIQQPVQGQQDLSQFPQEQQYSPGDIAQPGVNAAPGGQIQYGDNQGYPQPEPQSYQQADFPYYPGQTGYPQSEQPVYSPEQSGQPMQPHPYIPGAPQPNYGYEQQPDVGQYPQQYSQFGPQPEYQQQYPGYQQFQYGQEQQQFTPESYQQSEFVQPYQQPDYASQQYGSPNYAGAPTSAPPAYPGSVPPPVQPQPFESQPSADGSPVSAPPALEQEFGFLPTPIQPLPSQPDEVPPIPVVERPAPTAEEFAARRAHKPQAPEPTMGIPGLLRRLTFGAVNPPLSKREIDYREAVTKVRRNFGGLRQVTVVNPKGGAGKTVAVLMTAMTFGQNRGGYVLAWDNNETQGTLGMRAQPDFHTKTVRDVLESLETFMASGGKVGDLTSFVRSQGEAMFDVLASDESATAGEMLTAQAFNNIREIVSRFYKLIIVDTGNNVRAENWQASIDKTDQLIVTMSARGDSAETAARMLDHLEQTGRAQLVRQAVTVVSMPPTRKGTDLPAIQRHFSARTRTVLIAPYDRLLDSGEPIRYGELTNATRDAWLKIAAAVAEGL